MSASVKVMLYEHKTYSDGTHPIIIQVIVNRKAIKKVVGRCKLEQWDDGAKRVKARRHPNYAIINKNIIDEFNRIEKEFLGKEILSLKEVKQAISKQNEIDIPKEKMLIGTIKERMKHYYDNMMVGAYKHCTTMVSDLNDYLKKDIPMSDIDVDWIECYATYLETRGKKPNKVNTIAKKLTALNTAIKQAKKEGFALNNPFDHYKIKTQKVLKQKLTAADLEIFKSHPLPTKHQEMCRDIFLFQIYLRGMRIGDALEIKKSDIVNGRLIYTDQKTGKNYDIKLVDQVKEIIEKYKDSEGHRVFPILKWGYDNTLTIPENEYRRKRMIESCTSMVNNVISKIGKESAINKTIRTHIARHTFAKMAIDKIQNPMVTMGLLGHTSLKVHQNYLEDLNKGDVLDNATDLIFD